MPNVNRQDLEALRNMVSQAHLIVSTEPVIEGGIERARELLDTAERLSDFLLTELERCPSFTLRFSLARLMSSHLKYQPTGIARQSFTGQSIPIFLRQAPG